jgi:hypothetical protein
VTIQKVIGFVFRHGSPAGHTQVVFYYDVTTSGELASFFTFFSVDSMHWGRPAETRGHLSQNCRRHDLAFRHIRTTSHYATKRRGGRIEQNRFDQFRRWSGRNPPAVAAATQAAPLLRNRIAKISGTTLLHHNHAPDSPARAHFSRIPSAGRTNAPG